MEVLSAAAPSAVCAVCGQRPGPTAVVALTSNHLLYFTRRALLFVLTAACIFRRQVSHHPSMYVFPLAEQRNLENLHNNTSTSFAKRLVAKIIVLILLCFFNVKVYDVYEKRTSLF